MNAPNAPPAWLDTPDDRVQAHAILESFNAELLSHESATGVLERWCSRHNLPEAPHVVADLIGGAAPAVPAEVLALLAVASADLVAYRRVALRCGALVLSHAENWYVPERLPAEVNRALESSGMPFGKAARALHFHRRTLSAQFLWWPLPDAGRRHDTVAPSAGVLAIPDLVLEHRALLETADGPFSLVVERYTREVLAVAAPA